MPTDERKVWSPEHHEHKVEKFYEAGIGADQDWHGGYRNFGWWDAQHTTYAEAADHLVLELGQRLGLNAESHVLDVACGGAPQDLLLHRKTGARIEGVDVTWAQVREGQRRVHDANLEGKIVIRHGTATDLPFAAETFTHALCIEGAQHFNTRETFFGQAFRMMKPGGVLVLADFIVLREARRSYEKFTVRRAQNLWNVPDANVVNEAGYRASLERQGFTDISVEGVGKHTIPGYFADQNLPETIAAQREFKGVLWRAKMFWTNYFMYKAWEKGLLEYVIVRAVKPMLP